MIKRVVILPKGKSSEFDALKKVIANKRKRKDETPGK